ncbi:apoptosis-associated speck-like protein containing a CARD isoform 1-T1 [Menidia menidia]
MAPKTLRKCVQHALANLSEIDLKRFCLELVRLEREPRVFQNRVEKKTYFEVADVLVDTFTERGAVEVTVELLEEMDLSGPARTLEEAARACGYRPPEAAAAHAGAPGGALVQGEHFVDGHMVELIKRVTCVESILDVMLQEKLIQLEQYSKIKCLSTSHDKVRALYEGPLQAGRAAKDLFYRVLKEQQSFLIKDLEEP